MVTIRNKKIDMIEKVSTHSIFINTFTLSVKKKVSYTQFFYHLQSTY